MTRAACLGMVGMILAAALLGGCGKKGALEVPGRQTTEEPRNQDDGSGTVFTY